MPVTTTDTSHAGLLELTNPWLDVTAAAARKHPEKMTTGGCGVIMIARRISTKPIPAVTHGPGSLSFGAHPISKKQTRAAMVSSVFDRSGFMCLIFEATVAMDRRVHLKGVLPRPVHR